MELRRLRYLVKVVDAGGFRRASEMLNVAQPALTRQVQALEAEFGVPLLFRSAAGVTPTPQGEIVLREAREILARADALHGMVSLDRARVTNSNMAKWVFSTQYSSGVTADRTECVTSGRH